MRLLSHREQTLLARQGDIYNTAMSGTALMLVDTRLEPGYLIINVKVPAIPKENLNVVLDKLTLNIFSSIEEKSSYTRGHTSFSFPLNYFTLSLPNNSNLEHIEAKWDTGGDLKIIVPMLPNRYFDIPKRINIKGKI